MGQQNSVADSECISNQEKESRKEGKAFREENFDVRILILTESVFLLIQNLYDEPGPSVITRT